MQSVGKKTKIPGPLEFTFSEWISYSRLHGMLQDRYYKKKEKQKEHTTLMASWTLTRALSVLHTRVVSCNPSKDTMRVYFTAEETEVREVIPQVMPREVAAAGSRLGSVILTTPTWTEKGQKSHHLSYPSSILI